MSTSFLLCRAILLVAATVAPLPLLASTTTVEPLASRATVLGVVDLEVVFVEPTEVGLRFMASAGRVSTTRTLFERAFDCTTHCPAIALHEAGGLGIFVIDDVALSTTSTLAFDPSSAAPPVVVIDEARDGYRSFGAFAPVSANGRALSLVAGTGPQFGFAIV